DGLGIRGRVHGRVAGVAAVAGRRDHDRALAVRVLDGLLDPGCLPTAETQIDHTGAVVGRPDDALRHVRRDAAAIRVEDADGNDAYAGSRAGDAERVVDVSRDDA